MKITIILLFLSLLSNVSLRKQNIKRKARMINPGLSEGKICYQATPNYGGKKLCAEGLECKLPEGSERLMGAPHKCLPRIFEATLLEGAVCYRSTPGFGPKRKCDKGLECRLPDGSERLMGAAHKCLRRSFDSELSEGEICFQSYPDFGPKKKCAPGLECKTEPKSIRLMGAPQKCLPFGDDNGLSQGEVCFQSYPGFGPKKKCAVGLECKLPNSSAGMKGAAQKCLPESLGFILTEGEVCSQPYPGFDSRKKCGPGLECKTSPSDVGLVGASQKCFRISYGNDSLSQGEICSKPYPGFNPKKKCADGLECRLPKNNDLLVGTSSKCLPKLLSEGEICYQSYPGFGSEKECDTGLECKYESRGLAGAPKKCLTTSSSSVKLSQGEICYQSYPGFGPKKQCAFGLECKLPQSKERLMGAAHKCLPINNDYNKIVTFGNVCYQSNPDFGPKRTCSIGLECRKPDSELYQRNNMPSTGSKLLCLPPVINSKHLNMGDICFESTPSFGSEKKCGPGLVCKEEKNHLNRHRIVGAPKKCLPPHF